MDYLGWFPERIAELRTQRGVSARDMSLSLGQSESYINKIENRAAGWNPWLIPHSGTKEKFQNRSAAAKRSWEVSPP